MLLEDNPPVWRRMLLFAGPLLAMNVLQSASQTMSAIWIGRLVSTAALGAVSAVLPLAMLAVALVMALAGGGAVLIGHASGARDEAATRRVAGSILSGTLLLSCLLSLSGALAAPALLGALQTPGDIVATATWYARVVFATMPVLSLTAAYAMLLRGSGDAKTALGGSIVSCGLTIAVAPALIAGWGVPAMGVAGAAVAGLIGNIAGLAWLVARMRARGHALRFDASLVASLRPDWTLLAKAARIGVPGALQGAIVSLGEIAILSFVNRFGSNATAGYGAIGQVMSYALLLGGAIGIAASVFAAQAIGAGRQAEIGAIVRSAVTLNYAIGVPLVALCYAFSWNLLGLFIVDADALQLAHVSLGLVLWSVLVYGTTSVLSGVMRAGGAVTWPSIAGIAGVWGVEVPAAFLLMGHWGLSGVWIAGPIGLCASLFLQLFYYEVFWKRSPLARLA